MTSRAAASENQNDYDRRRSDCGLDLHQKPPLGRDTGLGAVRFRNAVLRRNTAAAILFFCQFESEAGSGAERPWSAGQTPELDREAGRVTASIEASALGR